MSKPGNGSPRQVHPRGGTTKADVSSQLELLVERLAENRQAIGRVLASAAPEFEPAPSEGSSAIAYQVATTGVRPQAPRRRLVAVVLLAVGAVILLTALVSLL